MYETYIYALGDLRDICYKLAHDNLCQDIRRHPMYHTGCSESFNTDRLTCWLAGENISFMVDTLKEARESGRKITEVLWYGITTLGTLSVLAHSTCFSIPELKTLVDEAIEMLHQIMEGGGKNER